MHSNDCLHIFYSIAFNFIPFGMCFAHHFLFLPGSRFSAESNQVQQIKKSTSAAAAAAASSSHFKKTSNMCGLRMAHDRWALNVKLAEARWAQQQARERELEEVKDFLQ